jgi:hypothetical protein
MDINPVNVQHELLQLVKDIQMLLRYVTIAPASKDKYMRDLKVLQENREHALDKQDLDRQIDELQNRINNINTYYPIARQRMEEKAARITEINESLKPSLWYTLKNKLYTIVQSVYEFTDRMTFPEDYDDNSWTLGVKKHSQRKKPQKQKSIKKK